MEENYNKVKKLIREGAGDLQSNFTSAMVDVKKAYPELSHSEVMDILKTEFERFLKYHSDVADLPKAPSTLKGTKFRDYIPTRVIPYGEKRKKG